MSLSLASTFQAGISATTPASTGAHGGALACPASPLVLAAVAGSAFALVLFSLLTLNIPYEWICILVVQLVSCNRRLLAGNRHLVMLLVPSSGFR